jgi:TCP-1/cpn60 chaperonin family
VRGWYDQRDRFGYVSQFASIYPHPRKYDTHSPIRTTPLIAGEILAQSLSQLERDIHPVVIISAYNKALQAALEVVSRVSVPIDTDDDAQMLALIRTSIGTKFVIRWSDLMCRLALDAVRTVSADDPGGVRTVDIKRYARVEKVPGGEIEDSRVLSGVMLNKDIVHPQMRRRIHKPRIVLLDCPLEYKKGESQTNIEISKEADFARINQIEEEQVKAMVDHILEFNPDLVITEKGISGPFHRPRLLRVTLNAYVVLNAAARPNRLCAILLRQGQRLCAPTCTQVGQQPHCSRSRCYDREPRRRSTRIRHRNPLRVIQRRKDGRRVRLSVLSLPFPPPLRQSKEQNRTTHATNPIIPQFHADTSPS